MPLVGLECCDGKLRTFEECLTHARDHHCAWTEVILSAIVANIRPPRETPSITDLLNCRRKTVLGRRLSYYGRPESLYWMLRGAAFHQIIAMAQPEQGAVVETRFERTLPSGLIVSGQPDVIYPARHLLVDYKSTRRVPRNDEPYGGHALQTNGYRWLVAPRYEVFNLEIVYMDMMQVKRVSVALMDMDEIEAILDQRAQEVMAGWQEGVIPEPVEPEGRWQCCDKYCPFVERCWPEGVERK